MREFYSSLIETATNVGIKILSDDDCCKLLAWTLAYGGANEYVVHNIRLNEDIRHAQKRCNITGGAVPNKDLLPLLQKYMQELKPYMNHQPFNHPSWVIEIFKKYKLNPPK